MCALAQLTSDLVGVGGGGGGWGMGVIRHSSVTLNGDEAREEVEDVQLDDASCSGDSGLRTRHRHRHSVFQSRMTGKFGR